MDADAPSPHSASPSREMAARRVRRTYGKPKTNQDIPAESFDPDTSAATLVEPSSSNTTLARQSSVSSGDEEAGKKRKNILDEIIVRSETRSDDERDGECGYDFSWKQKLKAMDVDDEDDSRSPSMSRSLKDVSPLAGSTSMSGRDATGNTSPHELSAESLPPLTQSPSPGNSQLPLTAESSFSMVDPSPVRPAHVSKRRVVQDSDSEEELPVHVSNSFTSSSRKRVQSAKSFDSEDDDREKPARPLGKGKSKAKSSMRKVTPLAMEEVDFSSVTSSKEAKRDTRSKRHSGGVKKPTKKEMKETRLEQARLMAERDGRIASTTRPLSHLHFLSNLEHDKLNPTKKKPQSLEKPIPPSDPIQEYSSPTKTRTLQAESSILDPLSQPDDDFSFGSPSGLLVRSPMKTPLSTPSSPLKSKSTNAKDFNGVPDATEDSDPELVEFAQIMREDERKREEERKKQDAHRRKLQLLQEQERLKALTARDDSDADEDELIIVKEEKGKKPLRPTVGLQKKTVGFPGPPRKKEGAASNAAAKRELHMTLIQRYEAERKSEVKKKEEDYIRRGGKLKETVKAAEKINLVQKYAERMKANTQRMEYGEDEEEDESDGDYKPDEEGSGDESVALQIHLDDEEEAENDENARPRYWGDEGDGMQVVSAAQGADRDGNHTMGTNTQDDEGSENEDDEAPRHRRRAGRLPGALQESDEEQEEQENYSYDPIPEAEASFTLSVSSVASTSEDEDKENDPKMVYDRDEDKENKIVPRGTFGSSPFARLFASQSREALDFSDDEGPRNKQFRSPFAVLSEGGDAAEDPFAPGPSLTKSSTLGSPIEFGGKPSVAGSPTEFQFKVRRDSGFSQFSDEDNAENDENAGSSGLKPAPLLPAFSQFFEPTLPKSKTPMDKVLGKRAERRDEPIEVWLEDSDNDGGDLLHALRGKQSEEVLFTQDAGLQPALVIDDARRRELDAIFEREQELVVQGAIPNARKEQELYVNEHGFYTQTRPVELSQAMPSPTQSPLNTWFRMKGDFSLTQSSKPDRRPLEALAYEEELDPSQPKPLRRLRRQNSTSLSPVGSPSPVKPRNAFDMMQGAAASRAKALKAGKKKIDTSEFIEGEAEESDEDNTFGFAKRKTDDGEDGEDEDDDEPLKELVDDTHVDVQKELVLEKVREHQEEDDKKVEQVHLNATKGKYRNGRKRRDNVYGSDDSESEEEDRSRVKPAKRRKIDGDTIDALEANPETRPFVTAYHEEDDDREFEVLQDPEQDAEMPDASQGTDDDGEEEPQIVSRTALNEEIRAVAQGKITVPRETFDPHDADWIDGGEDDEEYHDFRVREVERRGKATVSRMPQADMDSIYVARQPLDPERQRRDLAWAAGQKTRGAAGVMASVHGATVTGFGQSKKGGKSSRMSARSGTAPSMSQAPKPKPRKEPSVLNKLSRRNADS